MSNVLEDRRLSLGSEMSRRIDRLSKCGKAGLDIIKEHRRSRWGRDDPEARRLTHIILCG